MTIRLQAPGLGWTGEWLDVPAVYEDEDDRSSGFPKRVSCCRENLPLIEYAKAPVFVRLISGSLLTPKKSAASFVLSWQRFAWAPRLCRASRPGFATDPA